MAIVKGSFSGIKMQVNTEADRIRITIPHDLVNKVTIISENSGIPGLIGPNIDFALNNIVEEIKEKAQVESKSMSMTEFYVGPESPKK